MEFAERDLWTIREAVPWGYAIGKGNTGIPVLCKVFGMLLEISLEKELGFKSTEEVEYEKPKDSDSPNEDDSEGGSEDCAIA